MPASSKELRNIQTTIECEFTLKRVRDMKRTYSQMHRTYKHSEHFSIVWSVWPNGWVFFYELSGSRFESSCSHLTFRFYVCFEQGAPSHSGNYRVWIHSEIRMWHVTAQLFGQFGQMLECSFMKYVVLGSSPVAVTKPSDFGPASSSELFDIQATIECGFTLKRVLDMTRT